MRIYILRTVILSAVILISALPPAHAAIDIGGLVFEDNAFADRIMSTDYTGLLASCAGHSVPDLAAALTGADLDSWIDYGDHDYFPGDDGTYDSEAPPDQYIELSFTDNLVINGEGPDIAIFQLGAPNAVRVSLDLDSILNPGAPESVEMVVLNSSLGITNSCGIEVNVGYIDLDDFDIDRNARVYHLFVSSPLGVYGEICGPPTGYPPGEGGVPELAAVGALNSGEKVNEAPLVDELAETVISLPVADLPLAAAARDDGLPQPETLTCLWQVDSGSGPVVFDDDQAFETVAHFSVAGRYDLSVTVSDGDLSTVRTMSLMVTGVDEEPPSAPAGLVGEATSSSRVRLSWQAAGDNVAVAGYEVYRDGALAGSTTGLSFVDDGLQMLTTYDYSVVAVDASGNPSAPGAVLPVSTLGFVTEVLVGSGDDDAEETNDGSMILGSVSLDLVESGISGQQVVGLRFDAIPVPRSAEVLHAWIRFTAHDADSDPASLLISAEDSGDAAPFSETAFDLTSRPIIAASAAWDDVDPWPAAHYHHTSPDLAALVQPLLNRPDWDEGNAMAFLLSGSGSRRAKPFESGYLVAPTLHIEYALAPPVNQAPVVDAGDGATISMPGPSMTLAGSVSDDGLPDGTLEILWSWVSGPGPVSFADRSRPDSQAVFSLAGEYVLELAADDGEYLVSDTVTVLVTEPDLEPPSVPQNLTATPWSGSQIDLAWSPSTDDVALAGYVVYRDGVPAGTTAETSFSDIGLEPLTVYQYAVSAIDAAGNESEPGDTVFAVTLQESYAVSLQVADGNDDAEEGEDGSIQLGSSDLELVEDTGAGTQTVGLRFDGVGVPQGAWVTAAWIEFEVDEVQAGPASLQLTAEDTGHAAAFSSTPFDITARLTVPQQVPWDDVPVWDAVDVRHVSPDLSVLVQLLVDRGDWVAGNAMAFIITGSGVRTAESYEGERFAAPILHVEYASGVPVNSAPFVDAGPDATSLLWGEPHRLAGIVFDDGLPYGTVDVAWSQVSGPGVAQFSDATSVSSEVSFDTAGTWELLLEATDGEFPVTDTVTITVVEDDLAPPAVPQHLSATWAPGRTIQLDWDPSTDDVAVAGYVIYRDGVPLTRTVDATFTDSQPLEMVLHEYAVEAFDQAYHLSGLSDPVTIFTGLRQHVVSARSD